MNIMLIIKVFTGFVLLILGIIGLFIPVWPTTPFVLVSIGCFSSTPQIQEKILKIRFIKHYHDCYAYKRQIPRSTKMGSLLFLWCMMIISILWIKLVWITALLITIGLMITIHIMWIGRRKKNE